MPGKLCSSIKLRQALGKHGSARSVCSGRGEGRAVPVPQTGPFAIGATTGSFLHLARGAGWEGGSCRFPVCGAISSFSWCFTDSLSKLTDLA